MNENGVLTTGKAKTAANRRSFMQKLGLTAAGTAVAAATADKAFASGKDDFDDVSVCNFLLNLEYLMAEYYTVGTTGSTIDKYKVWTQGTENWGPTTGGRMIPDFHTPSRVGHLSDIATQISWDEMAHIWILQDFIHHWYDVEYDSIAKPAINLNGLGIGFGSYQEFVMVGRMLEDIVASAYSFLSLYVNDSTTFNLVTQIGGTAGMHSGNLRAQAAGLNAKLKPMDCLDFIPPTAAGGRYFSTIPELGLPIMRTPPQVLYLLYGNKAHALNGGFFPAGVNLTEGSAESGSGTDCYPFALSSIKAQISAAKPQQSKKPSPTARVRTQRAMWNPHQVWKSGKRPASLSVRRTAFVC